MLLCNTVSAQQQPADPAPGGDLAAAVESVAARTAVPDDVVDAALGGNGGTPMLQTYFGEPVPDRIETTGRGVAVIDELIARSLGPGGSPETFYAAARRARDAGISRIFSVPISRLVIAPDFVPPPHSYVWDIGGPDSNVAPGFNRLTAGDPGVAGFLEPYSRPGAHLLSGDGLTGVREFKTEIDNGRWRVTLIGDAPMTGDNAPAFGGEIVANGTAIHVNDSGPDSWLPGAIMARGGAVPNGGEDFQQTNQAVVVQFEVDVIDSLMTLQFMDDAAVSAVIIEPFDRPASVAFEGPATDAPLTIDEALTLAALLDARLWDFPEQPEILVSDADYPPPAAPLEPEQSP